MPGPFTRWLRGRLARRDLDEEIEAHRLHAEARAVAIAPWLDSVIQDAAYTLRIMRRVPGFAAAMIVVMALGIGATTSVFGLLDGLVLRSLPVHEPHRLVYFAHPSFSHPVFSDVRSRAGAVLSSIAAWDMEERNVGWSRELEPTEVLAASGEFYATLGVQAVAGRTFGPDDDQPGGGRQGLVAVISHAAWQRRFGRDPSVIGRPLRIDEHTFTVVGVTPEGFFGVAPGLAPEVTIPLTSTADIESLRSATSSAVHLLARLRDGISRPAANAAFHSLWPAVMEATTPPGMPADRRAIYLGRTVTLESARAGYSDVRNQFEQSLWILFGLVTMLLAVACASAANLLLSRGVARRREIAVRLAIGAARPRLIRQLLTETLVWTAAGAAAGLLLAVWGGTTLVAMMSTAQESISLDPSVSWRTLLFASVLAMTTAAVCCVIPAFRATSVDLSYSLKDTSQIGSALLKRWSFGRFLVTVQIALTVMLLFGASLFVRSLTRVLGQDAGFDRDRVVVAGTDVEGLGYSDERRALFYSQLLDRLHALPGVESASLSQYPPISGDDGAWTQSIAVDGGPVLTRPGQASLYFNTISAGYFRTTGMSLLSGRDFTSADATGAPRVAIVNESLARRFFPGREALGRHITVGRSEDRRDLLIVGIVRDAKYQRLQEERRSIAYLPWTQHPFGNLFAEVRVSGAASIVAEGIRREVRALDATVPLRLQSVGDRIRESLVTERVVALLAAGLGAAALVLACAGVYGLLAYTVSSQTREIGLRLALGADRGTVLRMVLRESMVLAALGIASGLAGALVLGRSAGNLLFQISPRDPVSFAATGAIVLAVVFAAGYIPARRAAQVDPAEALRVTPNA